MDALWRLLPVTMLTVRQFSGGKTARLVLLLSCFPVLFAAIFVIRPWSGDPAEYLADLFRELIVPTLLPIVVLLPATAALGNELEDGTLPYLLMKPVSRARIVLGKYLAIILVTIPALIVGVGLTTVVVSRVPGAEGLWPIFVAMAGAAAVGALLLGALFLLVSLLVPRALLAGMIYVFAWESLLGRFLPGVQAISSREYTLRVFEGLLDGDSAATVAAISTIGVVILVCLVLAIWRLSRMQID